MCVLAPKNASKTCGHLAGVQKGPSNSASIMDLNYWQDIAYKQFTGCPLNHTGNKINIQKQDRT